MRPWYALQSADVLAELRSTERGLSKEEAASRLIAYGENRLPEARTDGYLAIFLRQFASPLIYLLFAAAVVMYATGDRGDALIILFVLLFNSVVGAIQEGRAQNTLKALKHFAETMATVMRDGQELIVRDCEVVPGDVIVLEEGAKVPADARIIYARSLRAEEASLTGESEPVDKQAEPVAGERLPLGDQSSMVFKGTNIAGGTGHAVVVATGIGTEIGKIAERISAIDTDVPLKTNIKNLSRAIIVGVAILGTSFFFIGLAVGNPPATMFSVVIALAVSVIPEGLPIVITLVLATGVWRMGKRNVLVKRLQAVEALGQAKIIAVDKTGTITKNELMVERVWTPDARYTVTGAGYDPEGAILKDGESIDAANHPDFLWIGRVAAFSANAQTMYAPEEKRWRISGDPTEAAILVFGAKAGFRKTELERESPLIAERPFDYRVKYHVTLHKDGAKNLVTVAGAPEALLALSTQVHEGGKDVALGEARRAEIEEAVRSLSGDGLRVIAFATRLTTSKTLDDRTMGNLVFSGLLGMRDALRPEAAEAMARAKAAGIRVVMITGDHKLTAVAIAREVGIHTDGDEVATGEEIDNMTDAELARAIRHVSVFARVTPEHKLRIITAYRLTGDIVAMTGDGVNDAPSLVAADLGVSMGTIGTEVAKEAADIILLDDNFGSIVSAVEEGRSIYKTIKKVVLYLFSTGVGEAITIVGAVLIGMPLPLLAAQIIWLNFVTDGFLDIALAMEPKEKHLLEGRFKRQARFLLDRTMFIRMLLMAVTMAVGTLYLFSLYLAPDLTKAWTISLTTLAAFQWFNAWNCRSDTESVFRMNPFGNLYLIGATILVIGLQVLALTVPFLQDMLHTTELTGSEWLACILVAASIVVVDEVRKLVYRLLPLIRRSPSVRYT